MRSLRGSCEWRCFEIGCLHIFSVSCIFARIRICGLIPDTGYRIPDEKGNGLSIQNPVSGIWHPESGGLEQG